MREEKSLLNISTVLRTSLIHADYSQVPFIPTFEGPFYMEQTL
jgi:hypothetical protein